MIRKQRIKEQIKPWFAADEVCDAGNASAYQWQALENACGGAKAVFTSTQDGLNVLELIKPLPSDAWISSARDEREASAVAADARSDAASASIAARRGELRRKMSLTRREAPRPTTLRPSSPSLWRRQSAKASSGASVAPCPAAARWRKGLEARRAHVGASAVLLRRAAERERLIAQAMALGQQKQRPRIDLLDPRSRRAVAPSRAAGGDEIERLVVERDRGEPVVRRDRSRSPPVERAACMPASRRSVRSSTRCSGVCGSASIAPAARTAADRARRSR